MCATRTCVRGHEIALLFHGNLSISPPQFLQRDSTAKTKIRRLHLLSKQFGEAFGFFTAGTPVSLKRELMAVIADKKLAPTNVRTQRGRGGSPVTEVTGCDL